MLKYKQYEINIQNYGNAEMGFSIQYTIHQDHAGLSITADILGPHLELTLIDGRHWDDEQNDWF
jgi:hypothetical protein